MSTINSLNRSLDALTQNIQQLSSGNRINSASDDAAGLAIATQMSVQISGTGQALSNIDNSLSMVQTASSGLGQMSEAIQNIRDLTVQAGDGALNADDRSAIQTQINQNLESINTAAQTSNFNGQNLFDGSFSTTLQTGPNAGDSQSFSIANNSSSALGLNGIDVTNPSNISDSLDALDQALTQINTQQSALGAITNGLQSHAESLTSSNISLTAAQGSIQSTDFAAAISESAKNNTLVQAGLQALKIYNDSQQNKLALLK